MLDYVNLCFRIAVVNHAKDGKPGPRFSIAYLHTSLEIPNGASYLMNTFYTFFRLGGSSRVPVQKSDFHAFYRGGATQRCLRRFEQAQEGR